jgi:hypothetical protein
VNPNVALADAWLKVIYRNVTEQDLRLLLADIRGEAIQVAGAAPAEWDNAAFTVNLNHPAWRTGDEAAIRARLLNRVPVDVGITYVAGGPTILTEADINAIFASQNDVQLTPNDPTVTQRSTLTEAVARRAPIEQLFAGTADARELMLALATVQRDPTTVLAIRQNAAGQEALARKGIAENVANIRTMQPVALPSGMRPDATLVDAHAALDDITRAGTGARALLLDALAAWDAEEIRFRTETAAFDALVADWEVENNERKEIIKANDQERATFDRRMEAYTALLATLPVGRRGAPPPPVMGTLSVVPAPTPKPTARPAPAVFRPPVLPGIFSSPVTTPDAARARLAELELAERALNAAIVEFEARGATLQNVARALQGLRIQNIPALFPMLTAVCPGTPATFVHGALPANFNYAALALEIERNIPGGLKAIEEYVRDIAGAAVPDPNARGSAACWAVIRRGLEHQGLAGKQLEDTLGYMRSRMQSTPEVLRDLDVLADSAYPVNPDLV